MSFWFHYAFDGIWSTVWHWGIGVGAIILLVAAAEFTTAIPIIGPWLEKVRKDLLWVAVAIAILLIGEFIGGHDRAKRDDAKGAVVTTQVHKAVTKAHRPAPKGARGKWDTDL